MNDEELNNTQTHYEARNPIGYFVLITPMIGNNTYG
jgi:hypothetical protein